MSAKHRRHTPPGRRRRRSREPSPAQPPASEGFWTKRKITFAGVFTFLGVAIAAVSMLADVSSWRARASADLRFVFDQPKDALTFLSESPIRRDGDRLVQGLTATIKFRLTNLSRTPGFVNAVELVPASADIGNVEEILSITRREISEGETQTIEVTARIRTPVEPIGPIVESAFTSISYGRLTIAVARLIGTTTDIRADPIHRPAHTPATVDSGPVRVPSPKDHQPRADYGQGQPPTRKPHCASCSHAVRGPNHSSAS